MTYSRPQLKLLLVLAAVFLAGLGVREWRAGFPDAAERLERFDREDPPPPRPPAPRARAAPRWAGARPDAPASAVQPPRPRATAAQPAPVTDPRPLDLNHASTDEISRLPGVGPSLARRIVEERDRRGRFESSDSLRGILGMGPKKLAALRVYVTVGE
ncbi:MAG: helix-hairpin-helix domain-containing protein [Candidatus Rokubacteria bacterium]|nr:helix-hairpin-helix domain-containing protein [Candidatus Rokubacteria bacterium]